MPSWANVKLVYFREIRDQLRDRRTLFTIAVLPLFLYPLLGMSFLQITQFMRSKPIRVCVLGAENLPSDPPLIITEGGPRFSPEVTSDGNGESIQLEILKDFPEGFSKDNLQEFARQEVQKDRFDAVLYVPEDFAEKLAEFRSELAAFHTAAPNTRTTPMQFEGPQSIPDSSKERSVQAAIRVKRLLDDWCQAVGRRNLEQSNLPPIVTSPFRVEEVKGPEKSQRQAMLWSKILPFVALIWALTGAFYPAIDLCAGEKERGTLETLLSSPALRSEIVWGKLLTVMSFSMATSLLNLASLTATGAFIMEHLDSATSGGMPLGPPPPTALGWLAVTLVPISGLFSALSLAIASFARSSKEGQYYLMPLLLICLPLMMLPMPATTELDLGTSLIPITGMMLLLRSLIEGQYITALTFAPPVLGVTFVGCLLSIRWAIDQFNNENVLFNEGEQLGFGVWLRHMLRDREDTPTFGMAILCGLILLLIRFFAGFLVGGGIPKAWNEFAVSTIIFQVALIAVPAILMTLMLTRNPRKTLLLRRPNLFALPAAVLLAICLHPAGMGVTEAFLKLYPMSGDLIRELSKLEDIFKFAPSIWHVLAVMALTPAICEEIAFRGFVLSGLRHSGHKWTAIVVSALFFGAIHGILQQSLPACVLGVVLGFLAVQTGSLLPASLFHLTYNSLSILLKLEISRWEMKNSILGWFYVKSADGVGYNPVFTILGYLGAVGLLYWFRSLPFQATTEEKLQATLDNQPLTVPSGGRASVP